MQLFKGQEALDRFAEAVGSRLREARRLHYKTTFQNLPISIENRKGSVRSGTDPDGDEWKTKMKHPYGYIRGTEGVDGDHVDVFVGPNEDAAYAYVVHSNNPETGEHDEDKVMLGFNSSKRAKEVFMQHYDDPKFFGGIDAIPMWKFSEKVFIKKHTLKKLVASMRESIPSGIGATGLDQSMKKAILGRHQMVNPAVRESNEEEFASLQLPEDMLEHGVKGMKWGVRHGRNKKGRLAKGQSKTKKKPIALKKPPAPQSKPDLAKDPRTLSMMQIVQRSQQQLDAISQEQKQRATQGEKQTPEKNHGEALNILKELGWMVAGAAARVAGLGGVFSDIQTAIRSPKGHKATLKTDSRGNHKLSVSKRQRASESFRESMQSFLREAKSGVYYAREMRRYGTDAEDRDLNVIREAFPDSKVNFAQTKRHAELGMGYFHEKIDKAKVVVIKPTRKNRLTAGVFSEARHAIKNKIPVYALRKGRLRRVRRVEALRHANKEGHFGKLVYRRRKKK